MKKIVLDILGHKHKIKDLQKSYQDFPCFVHKSIGDDGTPYLSNVVTFTHKCGCEIVGNGTIQFPLRIKFCKKHKS